MKKDKIIIGGLGIVLLLLVGVIVYLLLTGNKTYREITGTVIVADKEYVIIEAKDSDYLVSNIKGSYEIGDTIKFTYEEKDLDNKSNPKTIKISDEELVERLNDNSVDKDLDKQNEASKENNEGNNSSNNSSDNKSNTSGTKPEDNKDNTGVNNSTNTDNNLNNIDTNNSDTNTNADTAVINYFNDYQTQIKASSASNPNSTLKKGFVTIVDFLFYNGSIKGYTFKDLTNTAKLKVLAMALYFDGKIEEYFPGYKESISNTASKVYTTVKEKIVSTYLSITTSVCANNNELCGEAKAGFQELKNNFGLTWELLKSIAGDGLTNLKNWYEIWRES